jgi:hypothetical protein
MNYCDKINYHLYTAGEADFATTADNLLKQLPEDETVLRLTFFGSPLCNDEYVRCKRLLEGKVHRKYGESVPALSYVSQPPLDTPMALEAYTYTPDDNDRFVFKQRKGIPYVILENLSAKFLFAGGFQGDLNSSVEQQASAVFDLIGEVMELEGFPLNGIVRQWNYIERITAFDGEGQHYQSFNNARSACYAKTDWENGYPAATGIGTAFGGILVDFDAVIFKAEDAYAKPVDNRLQIAAHAYSDAVLECSAKVKSTPKFERAKSMTFGNRTCIYLSGTAAIRGEKSLTAAGLERQLHTTMENIAELTGEAEPVLLRVYLKRKADFEKARELMDGYNLNIPVSYMLADVCRDELLIEIEGIAIK